MSFPTSMMKNLVTGLVCGVSAGYIAVKKNELDHAFQRLTKAEMEHERNKGVISFIVTGLALGAIRFFGGKYIAFTAVCGAACGFSVSKEGKDILEFMIAGLVTATALAILLSV